MTQREPRKKPAERRRERQEAAAHEQEKRAPVTGRTPGQKKYLHAIKNNDVTICYGPAGTGKTYMPAAYAAELMAMGEIEQIILCRPMVEAGDEKMGALPGGVDQKMAPWTAPILDVLKQKLGSNKVKELVSLEKVKVVPFAYMRGRTFDNAVVLADEMQNSTTLMMKLLTGRMGENCRVVISGDLDQCDLKTPRNGLDAVVKVASSREMRGVAVVRLGKDDIVRSAQVRQWVEAWEDYDKPAPAKPELDWPDVEPAMGLPSFLTKGR